MRLNTTHIHLAVTRRGLIKYKPGRYLAISWWPRLYPDEKAAGVTRKQKRFIINGPR